MTHVSFGDGKGVIFLSFHSSFMWCEQFCPRKNFLFWRFLLYRETLGKNPETVLEPPQYCQYLLALYLNVLYIIAGISTPNFALVWKTAQFLPFAALLRDSWQKLSFQFENIVWVPLHNRTLSNVFVVCNDVIKNSNYRRFWLTFYKM